MVDEARPLTLTQALEMASIRWHGVGLDRPDWSDPSHSLALTASVPHGRFVLHAMFNAWREPLTFELPAGGPDGYRWRRCVDTALPAPDDFRAFEEAPPVTEAVYRVEARSCVLLVAASPSAAGRSEA